MANFWLKQTSSRAGVTTVISLSAGSQSTPNFGPQTYQIRIATSGQPAFFRVGDGAITAAATDALLGANCTDYLAVSPGQRLAAIQAGAGGSLSVTEMS
jgi:hypothetical protein